MRRIVAVLGMVILAGVAASSVPAEAFDIKVRVAGQAEMTSNPTMVLLEASYICPESVPFGIAFLGGYVSQSETGALAGTDFPRAVPCTGRWETVLVLLQSDTFNPPRFVLGHAFAHIGVGTVGGLNLLDERERSVRIVDGE